MLCNKSLLLSFNTNVCTYIKCHISKQFIMSVLLKFYDWFWFLFNLTMFNAFAFPIITAKIVFNSFHLLFVFLFDMLFALSLVCSLSQEITSVYTLGFFFFKYRRLIQENNMKTENQSQTPTPVFIMKRECKYCDVKCMYESIHN